VCTDLSFELSNTVPQPSHLVAHIHRLGSVTIGLVTSIVDLIEGLVLDHLLALGKGVQKGAVLKEARVVEMMIIIAANLAITSMRDAAADWVESPVIIRTRGSCGVTSASTRARRPGSSSKRW
jgi:hypothetical protein